jgi:thiol-disulfide isomerase/thioredoxin
MAESFASESRWRTLAAVALVGGGLFLMGVVGLRGCAGGGSGSGASLGTEVGRVAIRDAAGGRRTLADYRGQVVLVDVWATWCPPCRAALPEVAELQKAGGGDYVVLPVSVDQGGFGDVQPFLAQNPQLGLRAFIPDGKDGLAPFGEIRGIPTTLIIGRDGKLRERLVGYREGAMKQALDAALRAR